jgi:hypothetical protein
MSVARVREPILRGGALGKSTLVRHVQMLPCVPSGLVQLDQDTQGAPDGHAGLPIISRLAAAAA